MRLFTCRELAPEVSSLRIKASGCFNSCGQHHIADIGFLGVARKVGRHRMPHFQLVIGGQWTNNGGSYGLAVGAVPSKRVPDVVERVTNAYVKDRQQDETFQSYVLRIGKAKVRGCAKTVEPMPTFDEQPDMYSDWGDPRLYTTGDMGVDECAGEIVPFVQFGLSAAERIYFDAQAKLDAGDIAGAQDLSYKAMLEAARALTYERFPNVGTDPQEIHDEFKKHLVDTQLFRDHYAGDKFYDLLTNALTRATTRSMPSSSATKCKRPRSSSSQPRLRRAHGQGQGGRNTACCRTRRASRVKERSLVMKATRVDVKVFAAKGAHVEGEKLLKAFHGFIQQQKISDELLLDVTSYEHVKEGPGIMLIGHEGMYGLDESKGRLGVLYSQRRAVVEGFEQALRYTLRHALIVAGLLEKEEQLGGALKFPCDEIMVRINDRLHAPASPETWKQIEPIARKVLSEAFGRRRRSRAARRTPRELFTFTARAKTASSPTQCWRSSRPETAGRMTDAPNDKEEPRPPLADDGAAPEAVTEPRPRVTRGSTPIPLPAG